MKPEAFRAGNITEAVVRFAQLLRDHGMNAGLEETLTALQAAEAGLLCRKAQFRSALKIIFSTSPEEGKLCDEIFSAFWEGLDPAFPSGRNQTLLTGAGRKNASLILMGQGKTEPDADESGTVTGANETERLQQTDFSHVSEIDSALLNEIAEKLFRQMAVRLRRRLKNSRKRGEINLRRTIRRSIEFGGEPMELLLRSRRKKKQRLLVLLDVSGSMDKYSFYLLRFICALRERFSQMEVFVFSTSLVRISQAIRLRNLENLLAVLSGQVENWSGGTKIGECLQEFHEKFGKRMLNGSPTVLILSDGLDTGSPEGLGKEMQWLQKRARRIVWLNPLKGMNGYAPLAGGMKAALPCIDDFMSAHNLKSLLELEQILADV